MSKIKAIHINLPMHNECYVVGEALFPNSTLVGEEIKNKTVTAIYNMTVDVYEVAHIPKYEIFVDNKLFLRIENTPVSVHYELEDTPASIHETKIIFD